MHTVHPGNVAETKTLQAMLATVLQRFPIERVILVADRGLLSLDNIHHLTEMADKDANARKHRRMPRIGLITVSAIVATIGDADQIRPRRDLAAWLELTSPNKSRRHAAANGCDGSASRSSR
jgi:transposase